MLGEGYRRWASKAKGDEAMEQATEDPSSAPLAAAEAAIIDAVINAVEIPAWANDAFESAVEGGWQWEAAVESGFWIDPEVIPPVLEGIDTGWFDGLSPEREKAILEGAEPSESEVTLFRDQWLTEAFSGSDYFDDEVTFWHAFQLGTPDRGCILLAGLLGGHPSAEASIFGYFTDLNSALDYLRCDGILDQDFRRWRDSSPNLLANFERWKMVE